MPKTHICERCGKNFKQKSHLDAHMKRKRPCKKDDTLTKLIEEKVKVNELVNIRTMELLGKGGERNEVIREVSESKPDTKRMTYIDLFCGIGGFRYAFDEYNKMNTKYVFECIKSVDIKKDALSTYNINFNETNEPCDIRTVKNIPYFDILCAGFPCQPFSSAGKRGGLGDSYRGNLIYEVVRICEESKPKYIILENVSNILKLNKGRDLKTILDLFTKVGYNITYQIINSCDVGLAQNRERLFIVGCLENNPHISVSKHEKVLFEDIIDITDTHTDIPIDFINKLKSMPESNILGKSIKDKRGGVNNIHSWDISYKGPVTRQQCLLLNTLLLQRRNKKWAIAKGITWMDGMPLTTTEIKTFLDYPDIQSDLDKLVSQKYLKFEHPKELINGHRVFKTDSPKGYNIATGKLSFPVSKILHPKEQTPTLTATDSNKLGVYVGETIRRLNKNELKRLCGFPEKMIVPDGVNEYNIFGNMVCPPVVLEILKSLFP
jgi:DNA (cytosine-5)-methyltransferase 1